MNILMNQINFYTKRSVKRLLCLSIALPAMLSFPYAYSVTSGAFSGHTVGINSPYRAPLDAAAIKQIRNTAEQTLHYKNIRALEQVVISKLSVPINYDIEQIEQAISYDDEISIEDKEFLKLELVHVLRELSALYVVENEALIASDMLAHKVEQANKVLHSLAQEKAATTTWLSDGHHQQVITAFPFNDAAKSSNKHLEKLEVSKRVIQSIKDGDFTHLLTNSQDSSNDFQHDTKFQLAVFNTVLPSLNSVETAELNAWSQTNASLGHSSKLSIALHSKNVNNILHLLSEGGNSLNGFPLHSKLQPVLSSLELQEQINFLQNLSNYKQYASLATYYVDNLALSEQQKVNFWFDQLSNKYTGSSAAHALAKRMDANLAQRLADKAASYGKVQLANKKNGAYTSQSKSQTSLAQKRAVLALFLSEKDIAKQQLKHLIVQNSLPKSLAKEVAKW